ncbi:MULTISPECIES: tripartite tricarboxylate transporter TctB family protein [unclassified Variovorax]|uniref:tripartite tricarboxylate transporter TctB family protein n=1 Tax=unclassified Variovorax TaxID=663243 RepID=UPI001318C4A9|nr:MULTISPECIES: tripartite tricarboxylate transporter TctB family protein [unclassified Variovorax]VTU13951.1 Tripartite tricarboxylate transporter TctB family protein [Variovorax sp. SRS16]VTU19633.1 Tripartite tricarboxylate transporter TctB family protein [Variovorax sp. PBL-E5]
MKPGTHHNKKDYYGGALMVFIGLLAVYAGLDYKTGTPARMGPGFFPVAVGALLAVTGLLIALSARTEADSSAPKLVVAHGHGHGMPDLRGGVCIILATLAFLLFGIYGGLVPATFAIVFISALGDRSNTITQAILLSLAMCIIAVIVFWWALQLQLPLFQWGG